jgi:ankyrin repeat protein
MKYLKLFENFDSYDPYELMIMFPNKKAEMIEAESKKKQPNLNLVQYLITIGANLEWQNDYGLTVLHFATVRGRVEIVRMLIDAGANLDVQDNSEQTPLHWAAESDRIEIAKLLIGAGAKKDIRDKDGMLPYDLAETEEMKKLLKPLAP